MSTDTFEKFFKYPDFFYKLVGVEAYNGANDSKQSAWTTFWCYCNMININFVLLSQIIYAYFAIQTGGLVEIPITLSYMGFFGLWNIKISCITIYKKETTTIIWKLRDLYKNLNIYNGENQRLLGGYQKLSLCYILGLTMLFWVHNYPLFKYWVHKDTLELVFPYGWMPQSWRDHWPFFIFYFSQDFGGYTSAMGQLGNDLLLCTVAIQLIMQYRHLADTIEQRNLKESTIESNMKFLKYIVDYHQNLLSISHGVNNVFGVALLLNFMSSSFMVCFLGFFMTTGIETFTLMKAFLFFFCSLLQIFMICKCAQELIEASKSVGHAVYNHNWPDFKEPRYRKMLSLMIQRAQKPAVLQATTFLNISLSTMADLLQISYKFFALLRTLYAK